MPESIEVCGTDLSDEPRGDCHGHYRVETCNRCADIHLRVSARFRPFLDPEFREWGTVLFLSKEEAKQLVLRLQKLISEH